MYLIGLSALIATLWIADLSNTISDIRSVNIQIVILLCLLQCITIGLISSQWHIITRKLNRDISYSQVLDVNMAGTVVESITPALKAGGELTKVLLMRSRWNISGSDATAIICIQKIISLFPFMTLCLASLGWIIFYGDKQTESMYIFTGAFILFLGIFTSFSLIVMFPEAMIRFTEKFPVKNTIKVRISNNLSDFRDSVRILKNKNSYIPVLLTLSFIIWGLFGVKAYLLADAINIDLGVAAIFTVTILSYMIAMVPVSPGGIGTFEGSILVLLSSMGIASSLAITFALVLRFTTYWFAFLLSTLYLAIKKVADYRQPDGNEPNW
ncbi:conserved hypothetical protein [Methanosalsum zhilinae DSM 4017]|uniref:Lysylphosphatidylglycerol synthetase/UPF0104 n=1 Tax=Methanosalsum zhilinae (strain DSM 4017 / NBRC 107636 / OCM 62 / WeN5) TaxID=679901 RepID=F7XK73_METZD|nr:conserved hypothetical protein [Methanosalsum zhilinae DSM 4017]